MDSTLARFVRALRAAGLETSPADTVDAARAVALVGYADRAVLRDTLGIVLAKSADDKAVHDRLFDQFFAIIEAPADAAAAEPGPAEAQPVAADPTGDPAVDALLAIAASGGGSPGAGGGRSLPLAMLRAADAAGVDDIRFQSQTSYYVGRILAELGIGALESRLLEKLMERSAEAKADAQRLSAARTALQRQARALVTARYALYGRPATDAFLDQVARRQTFAGMAPADLGRMKAVVETMARRLAIRHGRRRRIRRTGRLDIRRTLRANAGNDGVPFTLVYKSKKREKPRIVAICDVSASVSVHARFLILFLYALHGAVSDIRTFAFSSSLLDIGPALESLPFEEAMATILKHAGGSGTDYGRAFADIEAEHADSIDRRTTVMILGDGRSNNSDPRLDLLADIAGRAKRVVWLCTEPKGRWGTGDSCMLAYRPLCSVVRHCASAADLERAVDDALEAYS